MALDKTALIEFLEEVDGKVKRQLTLVAAGGTALTLLDVKPSTRDVDFTGPGSDIREFRRILNTLPHGFKVDTWTDGQVFMISLPDDYLERSQSTTSSLRRLDLRTLHPVDLVVTKLGRYDERDREDIGATIRKFRLELQAIRARAKQSAYAGNEEIFRSNLRHLLASQ